VVTRQESGRSAKRPASARRATASGGATRTAPPKTGGLSGRAWALALVLLALVLAYGYPLRLYLNQEAQIQHMEASQAAQRAEIKALTNESAKYHDKAFLRALARARFQMVDPGVKGYVVLPAPVAPPPAATGTAADPPWYSKLWSSIRDDQ
jgi:cell division protein FtsB